MANFQAAKKRHEEEEAEKQKEYEETRRIQREKEEEELAQLKEKQVGLINPLIPRVQYVEYSFFTDWSLGRGPKGVGPGLICFGSTSVRQKWLRVDP